MLRKTILNRGCLAFIFLFITTSVLAKTTPTDQVQKMLDKIMAIQTDPTMQGEENLEIRRTEIKRMIEDNINFDSIAAFALGEQYPKLSPKRQNEFVTIFKDLFLDSYTRLVLNFLKKEKVNYIGEELREKNWIVITEIVRVDDKISVDYTLMKEQNGWRVTDIEIDDVSIAENYRNAFDRIIRKQSYEVLLEKMRLQQQAIQSASEKS